MFVFQLIIEYLRVDIYFLVKSCQVFSFIVQIFELHLIGSNDIKFFSRLIGKKFCYFIEEKIIRSSFKGSNFDITLKVIIYTCFCVEFINHCECCFH